MVTNKIIFHIPFLSIKEIEDAIKIHGRFIQKINKSKKVEVFEITNIFAKDFNILIELDKGKSGIYSLKELEKAYEFLDEALLMKEVESSYSTLLTPLENVKTSFVFDR